jgi:NACHT domain
MERQEKRVGPAGRGASSAGGRANEAGSVYRGGVAAYLAAHGLAGRGLEAAGYAERGPAPVRLSFETGEAVDDIRCELADGTVLRLQAKRACGNDPHLISTVAQWAGQIDDLRVGDMVGLATAEPKGPVRNLGDALERRRRSVPGPHTAGEEKALALVRTLLPDGMSDEVADLVLGAAFVMHVAVSSPREEGFRSAANLLDGRLVGSGSGSSAIGALQAAFWKQAKAGTGSSLDDWLEILAEAGLPVFPDAEGLAGARRRAELDALDAHRARLASRNGVLEYSLLADQLPAMICERLGDSLRASVRGHAGSDTSFLFLARRWPRMLLTGLPGMGKSTALVQAAACWAADPGAPIPMIVHLREIARRSPRSGSEITLAALIEAATAGAPDSERTSLRRALQQAVDSGTAALLLDGLDECGDRRAVVADGLAAVIGCLPSETGVVLTTRDGGLAAAERLNMPEARLTEPSDLGYVLAELLRHAAERLPAEERGHWVRQREQQLDAVRRDHDDLFAIPLFAVLLTLLLAQPQRRTAPRGRAQLLAEAVRDTVRQWEIKRLSEDLARPRASADQILDGFATISHAYLSRPGGCSAELAHRQIASMLKDRWNLSKGEAQERTREIAWFWDEHVGVFTASAEGDQIEARSRVFAEIGEAIWAQACHPEDLQEWITAVLDNDDCREQAILACGLSAHIANDFAGTVRRTASPAARSRCLLWAAEAAAEGAQPSAEELVFLMNELATSAIGEGVPGEPSRQGLRPGWEYVLRLATLQLPAALRAERSQLLDAVSVGDYEQELGAALAALSDAKTDSCERLEPGQVTAVRALLARPLPERPSSAQGTRAKPARYSTSRRAILPGHQEAAREAAQYATQLGKAAADDIYRIAFHGWLGDYERVSNRLQSLGFQPPKQNFMPDLRIADSFPELAAAGDINEIWPKFFSAASSLAPPRALSASEKWRYPDLATLTSALLTTHGTVIGFYKACEKEQPTLRNCMIAAAHADDLDLSGISAEATLALEVWPTGRQDVISILHAPHITYPATGRMRLNAQDKAALISALGADSDWLANIACTYLLNADDPQVAECAVRRAGEIAPSRRADAVMVAIANDPNPAEVASEFLASDDTQVRVGAAAATAMFARAEPCESWNALIGRALADDDQAVRLAAGAEPASMGVENCWSCDQCGHVNKTNGNQCVNCGEEEQLRIITSRFD